MVSGDYRGTPEGLQLTVDGGPFGDGLQVVHNPIAHQLVSRSPELPQVCGVSAPLQAPGLQWRGTQLEITSAGGSLVLDLGGLPAARHIGGRPAWDMASSAGGPENQEKGASPLSTVNRQRNILGWGD